MLASAGGCQGKASRSDRAQAQAQTHARAAAGLAADVSSIPAPKGPPRVATAPSHGFNDDIAWRGLDEGLAEAKAKGMPMMLVVHASWCGQCKKLKPAFQRQRIATLSQHFVMVNADQDQTPAVLGYNPDGTYLPRVLFFDPSTGTPDPSLQNPQRQRYHYYYSPNDDLSGMMEKALARHGKS